MTVNAHPASPLLQVFNQRILPVIEANAAASVVIARSTRKHLRVSSEFKIVPYKKRGRRIAVRNRSAFDRAGLIAAKWPDDSMVEMRVPKVIFVARGKAGLRLGDYILQCPQGTAVFLPPGTPHLDGTETHLETLPPECPSCSLLWITPMISGLACRMCHTERDRHFVSGQGEQVFLPNPRLLQLFSMLSEEASHSVDDATADLNASVFASLFLGLVKTVARDIQAERFLEQDTPVHEDPSAYEGDPITQATNYINVHYSTSMTLDEVSLRFFMSRALFTRKFRERTGKSFVEFLNARRLDQAKKLLAETEWTAAMISRYVGFRTIAYFHRVFTREVGSSPMEFRRRSRDTSNT